MSPGRTNGLLERTFRSLRNRNYRLYFTAQTVSMSGTWLQSVALSWLVLDLTESALALSVVVALLFGPTLLLGPWGGVLADRVDKRWLMIVTQSSSGVFALALGIVTAAGVVELWMVGALALLTGVALALDMPARQSFVIEMVGEDDVANAVGLNAVIVNASRIVGPALAGLIITLPADVRTGIAASFFVNAASFLVVITGLLLMRVDELRPAPLSSRGPGQLRAGLRHAWEALPLRVPLLMMAVVSTLGYNFSVLLPLLAQRVYERGAGSYSALSVAMGVGALLGALLAAGRARPSRRLLVGSTLAFGLFSLAVAAAPGFTSGLLLLLPMGASAVLFISTTNAMLQLNAAPVMRGRVMALWAMLFLGSTPIGAPIAGLLVRGFGVRWAIAFGGLATLAAGVGGALALRRRRLQEGECAALWCLPETEEAGTGVERPSTG